MKKALITLGIILAISFAAFVGLFLYGALGNGMDFYFQSFLSLFTDLRNISSWHPFNIVAFALLGVSLILTILFFVISLAKKKGLFSLSGLGVLFGLFPGVLVFANLDDLLILIRLSLDSSIGLNVPFAILYICTIVFGGISTLGSLVFFIFGLVYCFKPIKEEEKTENDSEGAAEPETLQEPEENSEVLPDFIPELAVEEPTVSFEPIEPEPVPVYVPDETSEGIKPEPIPAEETIKEEKKAEPIDYAQLAGALKDVVRDIVRDEIARSELNRPIVSPSPTTVTGATFGGPLVVQYFNGGINGVTPNENPFVKQENVSCKPEPVKEEKVQEEKKEEVKVEQKEEPKPEAKEEIVEVKETLEETEVEVETPVVEEVKEEEVEENIAEDSVVPSFIETPVEVEPSLEPIEPIQEEMPFVTEVKEKKVYERISFDRRMLDADKDMQDNYNALKNEILSYGVKSRVSNSGDTFRLHKKTYVKITIAGKSLKLYFALDPKKYADTTLPIQDAGEKGIYEEIPMVFKVRSELSFRRAISLIQDVMEVDHLEQGEILTTNWVEELKASSDK